ncbi:hypothetical protein A0H76_2435 [Hepatospora eriocheir]|uniref:Uncharacterized protein n=1 Tax=Hepatospora eriocheir TaxID=1081669 RepID=A0A1X0QFA1_9MICR|nr:hypothetical protein A0H76_2435 [Hepatospora eriocheir]
MNFLKFILKSYQYGFVIINELSFKYSLLVNIVMFLDKYFKNFKRNLTIFLFIIGMCGFTDLIHFIIRNICTILVILTINESFDLSNNSFYITIVINIFIFLVKFLIRSIIKCLKIKSKTITIMFINITTIMLIDYINLDYLGISYIIWLYTFLGLYYFDRKRENVYKMLLHCYVCTSFIGLINNTTIIKTTENENTLKDDKHYFITINIILISINSVFLFVKSIYK